MMLNRLRSPLAFVYLTALCIAGAARAEEPSAFSDRVQNGNKVEAAPEYSDYFTNHYFPSLGQPMADAIKSCAVPTGARPGAVLRVSVSPEATNPGRGK